MQSSSSDRQLDKTPSLAGEYNDGATNIRDGSKNKNDEDRVSDTGQHGGDFTEFSHESKFLMSVISFVTDGHFKNVQKI